MAGLERAYGVAPSTHTATSPSAASQQQQGNGKAAARQLPVLQFAQQAEFLRLASTALSAVQVRRPAATAHALWGTSGCSKEVSCCWSSRPWHVFHVLACRLYQLVLRCYGLTLDDLLFV
jgi:hypothetical protein